MKQDYIKELLSQAKAAGVEAAEAYLSESESFSAMRNNGALEDYQSNHTRGLGFRGLVNGRMGYASTEALDDESIGQLIRGVIESATLCESKDEQPLYQGGGQLPEVALYNPELDKVSPEAKLAKIEAMENQCKATDERYLNGYNMIDTTKHTVRIANSYGMDQTYTENFCQLYCSANVKENDCVSTGGFAQISRDFDALDPIALGRDSVEQAVKGLNAEPVASGKYRVIFWNEALVSLLGVFNTIFSAETEQSAEAVTVESAGYFSEQTDGLERVLTPESVLQMKPSELRAAAQHASAVPGNAVGRLITGQKWYFAAEIPEARAAPPSPRACSSPCSADKEVCPLWKRRIRCELQKPSSATRTSLRLPRVCASRICSLPASSWTIWATGRWSAGAVRRLTSACAS